MINKICIISLIGICLLTKINAEKRDIIDIKKKISEELEKIYSIHRPDIEDIDCKKATLRFLDIENDPGMHDEGTLQILKQIGLTLIQTESLKWNKLHKCIQIKKNNLKNDLLIDLDLKMLEAKKNTIHGGNKLIENADKNLSKNLNIAKNDLTNLINQSKEKFEEIIKKSENTIKSMIWSSHHASTYLILTIFCIKVLFNEYLFFKNINKKEEKLSKKELVFSFCMIAFSGIGLAYSLEALKKIKN